MDLQELRIGGISMIEKRNYRQAEAVANFVENFSSAQGRFGLAYQL